MHRQPQHSEAAIYRHFRFSLGGRYRIFATRRHGLAAKLDPSLLIGEVALRGPDSPLISQTSFAFQGALVYDFALNPDAYHEGTQAHYLLGLSPYFQWIPVLHIAEQDLSGLDWGLRLNFGAGF